MRKGIAPGKGVAVGPSFSPGHWRADKAGKPIPEPTAKPDPKGLREHLGAGRHRDPKTAENIKALEQALAPRRYRPG